jgi:hypothetical protein
MTQQRTDPFGIAKSVPKSLDTRQNSRGRNVATWSALGAGGYGALGGATGGYVGAYKARRGLSLLHSMGAKPSAARSLGIAVQHSARSGARGAAGLGAVGALGGAAAGLVSPARKRKKVAKSALGVDLPGVEKSLTGKPGDPRNTEYFAGSTLAANLGRIAGTKATGSGLSALHAGGGKTAAAGHVAGAVLGLGAVRVARKKTGVTKSAFGVELGDVQKADRHHQAQNVGAATTVGGLITGGAAHKVQHRARMRGLDTSARLTGQMGGDVTAGHITELPRLARRARRAGRIRTGSAIATAAGLGTLTAADAYGRRRRPVAKSAFGVDPGP